THPDHGVLSFFFTRLSVFGPPSGGCRFFRTPIVRFYRFSALCCAILVTPAGAVVFPHPDRAVLSFFCTQLCDFGPPLRGLSFFPPPDRAVV
ncbi:MAG: hypothetical protein KIG72_01570, partial [Bradymonadales bacterium]|nr:hypothetical protein [Bradymonadales bacterium]